MKRLPRTVLLGATVFLIALCVSASAATGPPGKATTVKPHTLVSTLGIKAFAQDTNSLAWIDSASAVHVGRLSPASRAVVGWREVDVLGGGPVAPPQLALAGVRALWPGYDGGASRETVIKTGALGPKPGHRRAAIVAVFSYSNDSFEGTYLGGLAGDGSTLVFGHTDEVCPGELCGLFEVGGGGVRRVINQKASAEIPNVDPPAMLAASHGRIAVAPAAPLPWPGVGIPSLPAVAANGPVEVYDLSGRLLSSVRPLGTARSVALSWPQMGLLVRRQNGTQVVERYDGASGTLLKTTVVPSAATDLGLGSGGLVYRVGKAIYTIKAGQPVLLWRTKGTPIGLSIEGRRIAWAVNLKSSGRIVALTIPR